MAGIFNVSTKTLRHYENIGLFSPITKGQDNQYRYYGFGQLAELRRIIWLRSMDIGVETIRALKLSGALQDDAMVHLILEEHAQTILNEIEKQQQLLRNVQRMMNHLNQTGGTKMQPKLVRKASFSIVGLSWSNKELENGVGIPIHWERFMSRAHEITGRTNLTEFYGIGTPQDSGEFIYIAGFEAISTQIPEGMVSINVPEQTYAVFVHSGSLANIWDTREAIYSKFLPENGLVPSNASMYELYDHRFQGNSPESQIDLYVPIEG
jgi:predicted transcriptional regulator YdeE